MKQFLTTLAVLGVSGCAACHQPSGPAPAGLPLAGSSASSSGTASTEAIPAVGIGWHTVCFSIPKPKLFAVPRPQPGPQVVGIPILTGGPQMMMAQPQPLPTTMHYVPAQPAPQFSQPQSHPEPQSQPGGCADSCTTEGCQTSQTQIMNECDALIRDIAQLQQELCIETSKASVRTRQ